MFFRLYSLPLPPCFNGCDLCGADGRRYHKPVINKDLMRHDVYCKAKLGLYNFKNQTNKTNKHFVTWTICAFRVLHFNYYSVILQGIASTWIFYNLNLIAAVKVEAKFC